MLATLPTINLDEQIEAAFLVNPYVNHRNLETSTVHGHVTLAGQVDSYFEKQMAQEAIRDISGVEEIENRLRVVGS